MHRSLAVVLCASSLAALLALGACRPRALATVSASPATDVRIVTDEADAALAILDARASGGAVPRAAWDRLFAAEGYVNLKAREAGMRRPFTDSAFAEFLESDTLLARRAALHAAVDEYRRIDVAMAGARALRYLPDGATIRARLYLLVKPRTNSFVYPIPQGRGIFLYVDPAVPRAVAERDVVTHEMHHIGQAQSCPAMPDGAGPRALARRYVGALGEGLAMLAAAGSPDEDPHALSTEAERARWRADFARWKNDLPRVDRFLLEVAEARLTGDSIVAAAAPFWGDAPGPWYTVGYAVSTTIERELGRDRLRRSLCDPAALLGAYNDAAARRGLPRFSERLLRSLSR
jgi:hypothetical protein